MKTILSIRLLLPVLLLVSSLHAQEPRRPAPIEILTTTLNALLDIADPRNGAAPPAFTAELSIIRAKGAPSGLAGRSARVAFQAPDHLALSADYDGETYSIGRDGQELWMHAARKKFGVVGRPGVARFQSAPDKKDDTELGPLKLPLPREQILLLPLLLKTEAQPDETIDGVPCRVIRATAHPQASQLLRIPEGEWQMAVRVSDSLPVRIAYREGDTFDILVQIKNPHATASLPATRWKIPAAGGDKIENTAVSHLDRFIPSAFAQLTEEIPSLPPSTGERVVVATEGKGRLELIDGTRVLFLKGTPEEMGRQQGLLLKKRVRHLVDRILYGVGVGSSLGKGRWFFGEIESAQARLMPFIDPRYLREMDALALAAGLDKEEVRLANFFPELFHCSGFALYGSATAQGRMYHGRVLDYLRGMGLEQNAVVMIIQPDQGHAWVNVSYAGFVGSVTAMNEKHIAIGEMGGRGEGNWDGKPMAQLMREVMEKAATIDEAVAIMRRGPRTCEYYYVISDANTRRAVGIAATPDKFETIWAGESHPKLPHAIKDAVLMSADKRYQTLVERVRAAHGRFDDTSARDLMDPPVCMKSNIQSVLFSPDTLDFWVANADSRNVASETRYTRYNLAELLKSAR